eukprot:776123-Pelagomonas_calceolata.AAC.1
MGLGWWLWREAWACAGFAAGEGNGASGVAPAAAGEHGGDSGGQEGSARAMEGTQRQPYHLPPTLLTQPAHSTSLMARLPCRYGKTMNWPRNQLEAFKQ